jgi:TRAP-type C4-dicarboxylate transport system permease small subunit
VASVLIGGILLLVVVDVVLRYFFNRPIKGVTDVCGMALVFITSLGMAWLLKEEGHVKIDIVLVRLSPRPQALTNAITSALGAVTFQFIAWYGVRSILHLVEQGVKIYGGMLSISIALLLIPLAIACFLFSIQFVRRSYMYLKSWRQGGSEVMGKSIDLSQG